LRFEQDADQRILVQFYERRDDGQAADELRDEAKTNQVLRLNIVQQLADALFHVAGLDLGHEADAALRRTVEDDLLETGEGAATDEQDIARVDLQEFLLRVLSTSLGRHRG